MPRFTSKLGSTFYLKKGRLNNKVPLICCHGGPGGNHLSLKPLLELSKSRQVTIFDQIGSGNSSSTTKSKWNITAFCKNLNELISHLGYDQVILYGSSWGGTLILEYYKRYPNKVTGLIFHSSLICEKRWKQDAKKLIKALPQKQQNIINTCEKITATDAKVYKQAMLEYYKKHVCRVKGIFDNKKPKSKIKFNEDLYQHMWGPSEFCATGTLKGYNGIATLSKISVPTLFLCGEYDESTPHSNKFFARKVKGSQIEVVSNASHSSLRERKVYTLQILNKFLSQLT
ncbi:MAG: proline iminopeptidase-family hydrolase [Halobacteriovoraceae bacterium]|jgi:proline iminopeptidase|nr:proline iminopeptidase-family hydrolase [Halobacteriovoraceae bacterium]